MLSQQAARHLAAIKLVPNAGDLQRTAGIKPLLSVKRETLFCSLSDDSPNF